MADEFAKVSGMALGHLAAGAADVVATAVGGPGAGIVAATFVATGTEWLRMRAQKADDAIKDEMFADMAEHFRRLDAAVEELRARLAAAEHVLDRLDMLTRDRVYSDFAKAVAEATTPEKREALVHAAAHQFDPTIGTPGARSFWMERIRRLTDVHVAFLLLFVRYPQVAFETDSGAGSGVTGRGESVELEATETDCVAFFVAAKELAAGEGLVIGQSGVLTDDNGHRIDTRIFKLTRSGAALVKFMT